MADPISFHDAYKRYFRYKTRETTNVGEGNAGGAEGPNPYASWDKTWTKEAQWSFLSLAPQIPLVMRVLLHARIAAEASHAKMPLFTSPIKWLSVEESPRLTCLFNMIINFPFSFAWHWVRVVFRILTLPISLLVSAFMQARYGEHLQGGYNIVCQDLISVGLEARDFILTVAALGISFVNMIVPNLVPTDGLEHDYVHSMHCMKEYDAAYNRAKLAYEAARTEDHRKYVAAPAHNIRQPT